MRWRLVRLTAFAAAIPAIAIVPGSSSVAMLDSPSAGSVWIAVADAEVDPSEAFRASGRLRSGRVAPASPRSAVDCYPIGRVRPTEPDAVRMPQATPTHPGPVPIPTVTPTCVLEQVPFPSELIERPSRKP